MASPLLSCLLLIISFLLGFGAAQQGLSRRRQGEQEVLQRILNPASYAKNVNPGGDDTGGRTNVTVNLYVRDILKIDEINQELTLQLTLRQQWRDPRLAYTDRRIGPDDNTTYIVVTDVERLWRPDLFISNDVESRRHDFAVTNAFTRIYPQGHVLSSERLTTRIRCPMAMSKFPFDTQKCTIRMASYGYTEKDIVFRWKSEDPVQINSRAITLPRHHISSFVTDYCDARTNTGNYSCIQVDFVLVRELNHWLIMVFLPCINMVIIGYLAFWLDPENILARLLLTVSALFVMATQISRLNERLPQVSYTKAIDQFTGICLTFAFIAVLESVIVNCLSRSEKSGKSKESTGEGAGTEDPEAEALKPESESKGSERGEKQQQRKLRTRLLDRPLLKRLLPGSEKGSALVDGIARLLYPLIFLLFLIVYFAVNSSA